MLGQFLEVGTPVSREAQAQHMWKEIQKSRELFTNVGTILNLLPGNKIEEPIAEANRELAQKILHTRFSPVSITYAHLPRESTEIILHGEDEQFYLMHESLGIRQRRYLLGVLNHGIGTLLQNGAISKKLASEIYDMYEFAVLNG